MTLSVKPPRTIVEDVLDDFGYRIRWSVRDYKAEASVYYIVTRRREDGRVLFTREGSPGPTDDTVEDIDEAEVFLEAEIKWDGCSYIELKETHFCGPYCYQQLVDLLHHLWRRAFELMGCEPEPDWAEARLAGAPPIVEEGECP